MCVNYFKNKIMPIGDNLYSVQPDVLSHPEVFSGISLSTLSPVSHNTVHKLSLTSASVRPKL